MNPKMFQGYWNRKPEATFDPLVFALVGHFGDALLVLETVMPTCWMIFNRHNTYKLGF